VLAITAELGWAVSALTACAALCCVLQGQLVAEVVPFVTSQWQCLAGAVLSAADAAAAAAAGAVVLCGCVPHQLVGAAAAAPGGVSGAPDTDVPAAEQVQQVWAGLFAYGCS
jgi:hypothetical protein